MSFTIPDREPELDGGKQIRDAVILKSINLKKGTVWAVTNMVIGVRKIGEESGKEMWV